MTKKGIKRASADVGLIFTAYNLRTIFNILDKNVLIKFLKELGFLLSVNIVVAKAFCRYLTKSFFTLITEAKYVSLAQIGSKQLYFCR